MIHPESIVHSLVEFVDGSVLAQMSVPDMRFAIQYALTWPERRATAELPALDLARSDALHFRAAGPAAASRAWTLARQAATPGGTLPAVLNAANEVAVQSFWRGGSRSPGIWRHRGAGDGQARRGGRPGADGHRRGRRLGAAGGGRNAYVTWRGVPGWVQLSAISAM